MRAQDKRQVDVLEGDTLISFLRQLRGGFAERAPGIFPIPEIEWKWQRPDGKLNMEALLREFQTFWRENSEIWEEQADYHEAFPHLLLMAFLQRVSNGAGRIEREYAAGRGRMDLAVEYRSGWDIIEIKLLRRGKPFERVKEEGVRQPLAYRDRIAGKAGG